MKLNDLAKALNDMFNNGEIDTDNFDFNGIEIHGPELDYDPDLYLLADESHINECMRSGHYDEQTLEQYLNVTDEDGNWLHPYNTEDLI